MFAELAIANAVFGVIKQALSNGKELFDAGDAVNDYFKAKNPTYMEVAGWPLKLALAEKYQSGVELTDSEKLRINKEIELRAKGETIDSLTTKVIVQSNGFTL